MPTYSAPHALDLEIQRQPDDSTCGPTCLQAVYRYFGDEVPLDEVIAEVRQLSGGGTLAVNLANHALRRGYGARILTYNLAVFDPSWFGAPASDRRDRAPVKPPDLAERLRAQVRIKQDPKLAEATDAYLEFCSLGGTLAMEDLTPALLRHWLARDRPILTGLSATFLYRSPREIGEDALREDDLRGVATGHFVVLCGWNAEKREVRVADPLEDNPRSGEHIYWLPVERVINAVLLGVLTYDANLLLLEPPEAGR
jgi:hypothetical protein